VRNPHRFTTAREAAAYMFDHFPIPNEFISKPRAYWREEVNQWERALVSSRRKARCARHREAQALAGAVGTDHPLLRIWVALLQDYENARERRSGYLAAAEFANTQAAKALCAGDLENASRFDRETKRLCEEYDKAGEEVAAMYAELQALGERLPGVSPSFVAAVVALLAELEKVAANVCRHASTVRPKVRPPRTRSTFANAPPTGLATELRRGIRAMTT